MAPPRRGNKGKRKRSSNAIATATAVNTLSSEKAKENIDLTDSTIEASSIAADLQPLPLSSQTSHRQPLTEKKSTQVDELAVRPILKEFNSESASQLATEETTEPAIDNRPRRSEIKYHPNEEELRLLRSLAKSVHKRLRETAEEKTPHMLGSFRGEVVDIDIDIRHGGAREMYHIQPRYWLGDEIGRYWGENDVPSPSSSPSPPPSDSLPSSDSSLVSPSLAHADDDGDEDDDEDTEDYDYDAMEKILRDILAA